MHALQQTIHAILQPYAVDPNTIVVRSTELNALGIDGLDLPMIFLDIEDTLDVQFNYHDDICGIATAGELMTCVVARLQAKRLQPVQETAPRRAKLNWTSTGAGRQR